MYSTFYSLEKYTGYNPLTLYWLPWALGDAALLHVFLACADSFLAGSNARIRPTSIKHMNASIRAVNEGISSEPIVVSDALLVIISTIAILEVGTVFSRYYMNNEEKDLSDFKEITGFHDNWRTHMEGLRQAVNLRGGLNALDSNNYVLGKICRYVISSLSFDLLTLSFWLLRALLRFLPFSFTLSVSDSS